VNRSLLRAWASGQAFRLMAVVLILLAPWVAVAAAQPVTVRSRDGSVVTGEVDASTDEDFLCVRCTGPGILVFTRVAWDRIEAVEHRGRRMDAQQFSGIAGRMATPIPTVALSPAPVGPPGGQPALRIEGQPRRRVDRLEVEATVADWDADVENDGLEVRLQPLDRDGHVVPLRGTMTAELVVQRAGTPGLRAMFPQIGRWVRSVRPPDVGPYGAVYRLEFQRVHPDFDLGISWDGLLHVRLGVPGQGTLDVSVPVWLRAESPLRDRLQLYQNRRFLPAEPTGRWSSAPR